MFPLCRGSQSDAAKYQERTERLRTLVWGSCGAANVGYREHHHASSQTMSFYGIRTFFYHIIKN